MKLSLGWKLVLQFVFGLLGYAGLFFFSAGTLRYWQGWAFLAVWFIPGLWFCIYFYKRDPALIERRLQKSEKVKTQRVIVKTVQVMFMVAFLIPGLDFRLGWTNKWIDAVPLWLEIWSLGGVLSGYLLVLWVMDVNRYAARTVQVEAGQKVISAGPYKWVRHPFYFGTVVMLLSSPLALGSYVALPVFASVVPIFVWRLLNEETVLCRELPGYVEYCEGTRYRLIPYIW